MKAAQIFVAAIFSFASVAIGEPDSRDQLEAEIARYPLPEMIRSAIGVTRKDTPIPCFISEDDLDPESKKIRVLLIGGLDGNIESTRAVMEALKSYRPLPGKDDNFAISFVPCALPDDIGKENFVAYSFPPTGNAYNQPENDVAHYLWRWTGMHAPDVVVVFWTTGDCNLEYPRNDVSDVQDKVPLLGELPGAYRLFHQNATLNFVESESFFAEAINCGLLSTSIKGATPLNGDDIDALIAGSVSGTRAYRFQIATANDGSNLWERLESQYPQPKKHRSNIQRRIARSPIEVAEELAKVYGHHLDPVMYIPSLAIVGRMRLGELTDDPEALRDAEKICGPYRTGEKESMGPKGNGSTISGHLVFSELARRTGDEGWTALAKKAADYGFDENGKPKESMPFHSEMSDSVFMGCAILAETGALTGEKKYFEQCLRHLRFMQKLCLREDGIYRHSPLDEAAWGRGNGFPALGLSLSLSSLPEDSEEHAAFLESYRNHLNALKKHQDPTGAWHQVIDHEESYREFTSTCMITFAIVRGLRRGWLEKAEWQPVVDKSWRAIKSRIGPDGHLVDVCTGTGKMKSLRDYFDRTAILGRDDRGGAMALMVSTEIAYWEQEREKK